MSKKESEKKEIEVRKGERRAIAPWYPSDVLQAFDDMWEDFRRGFMRPWRRRGFWGRPWDMMERSVMGMPTADLIDLGDSYQVRAEVPGISKDKLDITVTNDSVEISGKAEIEREEEQKGYVVRERGYSQVYRSMMFPQDVIPDKAAATLKNGILDITVPKKTPLAKPEKHKLKVK